MNNVKIFLFVFFVGVTSTIAEEVNESKTSDISKKQSLRQTLRQRRLARKNIILKKNPHLGIKPRFIIRKDVAAEMNRKENFKGEVKKLSQKDKSELLKERMSKEAKDRSIERTLRTQALIKENKNAMKKIAHLKRKNILKQRNARLLEIRRDLIKQNLTDLANNIKQDFLKTN
jgi:hypothetical protein